VESLQSFAFYFVGFKNPQHEKVAQCKATDIEDLHHHRFKISYKNFEEVQKRYWNNNFHELDLSDDFVKIAQ